MFSIYTIVVAKSPMTYMVISHKVPYLFCIVLNFKASFVSKWWDISFTLTAIFVEFLHKTLIIWLWKMWFLVQQWQYAIRFLSKEVEIEIYKYVYVFEIEMITVIAFSNKCLPYIYIMLVNCMKYIYADDTLFINVLSHNNGHNYHIQIAHIFQAW